MPVTYDEHTNEYRYLSTSNVVQLWDKGNVIFHEASKECYMFHKTVGHLMIVEIETGPAETRSLLCKHKMIRQNRSQSYPELTKMSRSEALRPASSSSSMINMTKPHSDMYTHHQFTELEQEYSNFLQDQPRPRVVDRHALQSFTGTGHKWSQTKVKLLEKRAWTVQYNGPFPLESQRMSPTQALNNEQSSLDHITMQVVKDMEHQLQYTDSWLDKV